MSRPNTGQSYNSEIASFSAPTNPQKYSGHNTFITARPPTLEKSVVAKAFYTIDTDRDSFINIDDVLNACSSRPELGITVEVAEAMFRDASSTRFSSPLTINPSLKKCQNPDPRPYKDSLSIDDVYAAVGYRKRDRDKAWVGRRMREQWLILIKGLLPDSIKDRMFAVPSPPLNTGPSLTSRERDHLNISPIGFASSRPSSPGSVHSSLSRPTTSLSEYFSQLSSEGGGPSQQQMSQTFSLERGGKMTRFPDGIMGGDSMLSGSMRNSKALHRGYPGGSRSPNKSPSVSQIMWRKRPRSRADGRVTTQPSTAGGDGTLLAVDDIIRVTTPSLSVGLDTHSSTSPAMPSTISPSMSRSMSEGGFMSPIKMIRGGSTGSTAGSPIFGFDGQQSHQRLSKQLTNSSQKATRQASVVETFGVLQKERAKTAETNQRPKTEAGRQYLREKKMKMREKNYDISCGNATVQKQWSRKVVNNAKDVLEDNRGWSNKSDAHEKRLIEEDKNERTYLRSNELKNFRAHYITPELQNDKVLACKFQRNFWGKSNQGTFLINEEKPYIHTFRDVDMIVTKDKPLFLVPPKV